MPVCRQTCTSDVTAPDHTAHTTPPPAPDHTTHRTPAPASHVAQMDTPIPPNHPNIPETLGSQHRLAPKRTLESVNSNGNHGVNRQALDSVGRSQHHTLQCMVNMTNQAPYQAQTSLCLRHTVAVPFPLEHKCAETAQMRRDCRLAARIQYMGWAQARAKQEPGGAHETVVNSCLSPMPRSCKKAVAH
jgi:hypothetical protein